MATVFDQLADAFIQRKRTLAERERAKTKLLGSDYFMPKSAKEDINNQLSVFEQGGLPGVLKEGAQKMYENPVVNTAISLAPGAGDLQSAFEAIKSAREGNYGEAGLNAVGVLPFIPSLGVFGKTVWHGSPHEFNKFDLSKLGTGEGAQAYGHGLYFADAPEVAKTYQPRDTRFEETIMKKYSDAEKSRDYASMQVYEDFLLHKSPNEVSMGLSESGLEGADLKKAKSALDYATKQYNSQTAGALYKVDLPDEQIAKMLDWDAPLSEQPHHIQEYAKKADISGTTDRTKKMIDAWRNGVDVGVIPKGSDLHTAVSNWGDRGMAASNEMAAAGIPGIKYWDEASRGYGDGTRNYVVFSDELPQILERNAQPIK